MDAYLYQADIYCEDCANKLRSTLPKPKGICNQEWDSEDYPIGPYHDGGGEADGPQYCSDCRTHLENPLTTEGYQAVLLDYLDALKDATMFPTSPIRQVHLDAWDFYCSATTPLVLALALRNQSSLIPTITKGSN